MGHYLPMEHRLSGGEGFPVNIHEVALERVRAPLGELSRLDPSIEMQSRCLNRWSRHLFCAAATA